MRVSWAEGAAVSATPKHAMQLAASQRAYARCLDLEAADRRRRAFQGSAFVVQFACDFYSPILHEEASK